MPLELRMCCAESMMHDGRCLESRRRAQRLPSCHTHAQRHRAAWSHLGSPRPSHVCRSRTSPKGVQACSPGWIMRVARGQASRQETARLEAARLDRPDHVHHDPDRRDQRWRRDQTDLDIRTKTSTCHRRWLGFHKGGEACRRPRRGEARSMACSRADWWGRLVGRPRRSRAAPGQQPHQSMRPRARPRRGGVAWVRLRLSREAKEC